jgi:hypothetical protein
MPRLDGFIKGLGHPPLSGSGTPVTGATRVRLGSCLTFVSFDYPKRGGDTWCLSASDLTLIVVLAQPRPPGLAGFQVTHRERIDVCHSRTGTLAGYRHFRDPQTCQEMARSCPQGRAGHNACHFFSLSKSDCLGHSLRGRRRTHSPLADDRCAKPVLWQSLGYGCRWVDKGWERAEVKKSVVTIVWWRGVSASGKGRQR